MGRLIDSSEYIIYTMVLIHHKNSSSIIKMYDVSYTVVVDIGRQTGQSYQSVNHTQYTKNI